MHWILLLYCRRIANPLTIPKAHPDRPKKSKEYSQVRSVISSAREINFSRKFRYFIFLYIALTMCSCRVSSLAVPPNLIQSRLGDHLHFSHSHSSSNILSEKPHIGDEAINHAIPENCILHRVIKNHMAQRATSLLRKKQSRLANKSWLKDALKRSNEQISKLHKNLYVSRTSNALVRQANAHLPDSRSRQRRTTGDRKLRKLYSKHGFLLEILPNGKVRGTYDVQSKYAVLEIQSVDRGSVVAIQGRESGLYLSMTKSGTLHGKVNYSPEHSAFVERIAEGWHNTYASWKLPKSKRKKRKVKTWYVGMSKQGKAKKGGRVSRSSKSSHFLPLPVE